MSDTRIRKIRILQHNCNQSDIAMHSCLQTAETSADIVVIQEPWRGTNSDGQNYFSISHPSFLMLMSPTTHCPRTLTYVSTTNLYLKASLQPDICSDEDIQVIKYPPQVLTQYTSSTSTTKHPTTTDQSPTQSKENSKTPPYLHEQS